MLSYICLDLVQFMDLISVDGLGRAVFSVLLRVPMVIYGVYRHEALLCCVGFKVDYH